MLISPVGRLVRLVPMHWTAIPAARTSARSLMIAAPGRRAFGMHQDRRYCSAA